MEDFSVSNFNFNGRWENLVLSAIHGNPMTARQIADNLDFPIHRVKLVLRRLHKAGKVNRSRKEPRDIFKYQKTVQDPEPTKKANCVFCGELNADKIVKFPETFTAYQFLQAGDKACPRCAEMFTDPKYRRNSWIMKDGAFTVLDNPLETLLNLPEPPFTLYLTKTKRKHGWVRAVQNPVLNRNKFILTIDEEKTMFSRDVFAELNGFADSMFEKGIPKSILLGGMPSASAIEKFGLSCTEYRKLRELHHDNLWRVLVEFKRRN